MQAKNAKKNMNVIYKNLVFPHRSLHGMETVKFENRQQISCILLNGTNLHFCDLSAYFETANVHILYAQQIFGYVTRCGGSCLACCLTSVYLALLEVAIFACTFSIFAGALYADDFETPNVKFVFCNIKFFTKNKISKCPPDIRIAESSISALNEILFKKQPSQLST